MMDGKDVLDVPMQENDADASTIRGYLVALVREVWREDEGFSGKRPFGNSGWKHEVYEALGRAGVIDAAVDEDGYYESVDSEAGDRLIALGIEALAAPSPGPAR